MNEEQRLKRIPYGKSDFKAFKSQDLYYVDKTGYIRNIEEKGDFLLLIRPRRFGKSLLLSTMQSYYDVAQKNDFDSLFAGTEILQNPTSSRNKFMILSFDFSSVDPRIEMIEKAFVSRVLDSAIRFLTKYKKLLGISAKDIKEITTKFDSMESASMIMNTFLMYCMGKEYKIYAIIDEYDNFANTVLADHGEAKFESITHGAGFLRSFFNVLKSGTSQEDAPIDRIFMTGVSPITMDDVTSGFNIATNISMDSDINEIMGFTHSEVETMIEYYRQTGKILHSTPKLMEIMSHWYNHYRFSIDSNSEVFNTVHVLYFLKEYMKNSKIPRELVNRNAMTDYKKLRHLIIIDKQGKPETNGNFSKLRQIMEDGTVMTRIKSGFPIKELGNTENFFSLLFYFGLLTIKGVNPFERAILTIANEFTKQLYFGYIHSIYEDTKLFRINFDDFSVLVEDMAISGNWQPAIDYIAGRMADSIGIRNLIDRERSLQVFLMIYLGFNSLYIVDSEKEMNQGYSDIVMIPLLHRYPAIKYSYLIELKYIKPSEFPDKDVPEERILQLKEDAEKQLMQYSQDGKFRQSIGETVLKKIVLIFCGNKMVLHEEVSV